LMIPFSYNFVIFDNDTAHHWVWGNRTLPKKSKIKTALHVVLWFHFFKVTDFKQMAGPSERLNSSVLAANLLFSEADACSAFEVARACAINSRW
jgi:hypothetical protein